MPSKTEIENRLSYQFFTSGFDICVGGGKRVRTADPLRARQVLSQLSYTPTMQLTPG